MGKKRNKKIKNEFSLILVKWTVWEEDDFGYPEVDGYSLHVDEQKCDTYIKNRLASYPGLSVSKLNTITNPSLYRTVRDKGGDLFTEEVIW